MASAAEQLAASINFSAFAKATDLKSRIWFTLGALVIYRLGTYIPLPGIDPQVLAEVFQRNAGGILGMVDMFSGGALGRMTIFALNIMPYAMAALLELGRTGAVSPFFIVIFLLIAVGVVTFIVFMERAQRRILVQYPKRQVGNKMFGGEASHLPLKLNTSGVIPPIFASSLLLLPATLASFGSNQTGFLGEMAAFLGHGHPLYILLYVFLIVFFCFFYTAIVFNPTETADNLRKYGGFVPGIRPGKSTADYLDYVLTRLTVIGALYLAAVCVLPEILVSEYAVPFYFGGTSLLIVVSVTMDTVAQIHSHLLAHQYEGLIKKSRLRGRRG